MGVWGRERPWCASAPHSSHQDLALLSLSFRRLHCHFSPFLRGNQARLSALLEASSVNVSFPSLPSPSLDHLSPPNSSPQLPASSTTSAGSDGGFSFLSGDSRSFLPGPSPPPPEFWPGGPWALTSWSHDGHLGPCPLQAAQPLLVLGVPAIVEAGGEDAQLHGLVVPQERDHLPRTLEAGAPGHEPRDVVFLPTGQVPGREGWLGLEPIQEADLCVDRLLGIELGETERGRGPSGRAEPAGGRAGGVGTRGQGASVSEACDGLLA